MTVKKDRKRKMQKKRKEGGQNKIRWRDEGKEKEQNEEGHKKNEKTVKQKDTTFSPKE